MKAFELNGSLHVELTGEKINTEQAGTITLKLLLVCKMGVYEHLTSNFK